MDSAVVVEDAADSNANDTNQQPITPGAVVDQQQQRRPPPPPQRGAGAPSSKTPASSINAKTTANKTTAASSNNSGSKKPVCNANISQFAIETYFIWFSALIFCTELLVDVWLAVLYIPAQPLWALTTAALIVVPLALCQTYSLWLLRTDRVPLRRTALLMHVLLLAIPYRYHGILRSVAEQDRRYGQQQQQLHWSHSAGGGHQHQQAASGGSSTDAIRHQISDVNAIQTMNATFQYCPQFLFQSFLIVYRKYKCILTGVSAGLAGFSFLWHIFIHFYYLVKRYHLESDPSAVCFERCYAANVSTGSIAGITAPPAQQQPTISTSPQIIDNLSSSSAAPPSTTVAHLHAASQQQQQQAGPAAASGPSSLISNNLSQTSTSLTDSLRNFEKPQSYKTDDKNLMSKRAAGSKMVEKSQIFGFNKRRPIYQQPHEEFDMSESGAAGAQQQQQYNASTVFFEIDDSREHLSTSFDTSATAAVGGGGGAVGLVRMGGGCNKTMSNKDLDNFLNENHSNANAQQLAKKTQNDYKYSPFGIVDDDDHDDIDDMKRENRLLGSSMHLQATAANTSATCVMDMSAISCATDGGGGGGGYHRNSLLKRKGICSSQEMLHLVDIMNDHISAEQVDVLAKSLVELAGDCSLPATESADSNADGAGTASGGDLDSTLMLLHHHHHAGGAANDASASSSLAADHSQLLLLDHFPQHCDDRRLLENIDAAIYENQIIFQERIRKNQLTIQNLKLQDQMLSKCIEDMKSGGRVAAVAAAAAAAAAVGGGMMMMSTSSSLAAGGMAATATSGSEVLSIRDYENMCFTNIARQQRGMKHWRNYFQDMDTSQHDSSTVQHSSYYVNTNTMSNSTTTDLYINEEDEEEDGNATDADDGGASTVIIHDDDDEEDDDGKGTSAASVASSGLGIVSKKGVRWSNKLAAQFAPRARAQQQQQHRRLRAEQFGNGNRTETGGENDHRANNRGTTTAISSDVLYINMNQHLQRRAARMVVDAMAAEAGMDASTATQRGSNSSVVVELDEEDDDNDNDENGNDELGAVALPQKNILVETINKINVDSPVKSLLGELKSSGGGGGSGSALPKV